MSIDIGITGGIGSGKSVVSRLLTIMEIPVYDTDTESKKLTNQNPFIREKLESLLGKDIYNGRELNKSLLATFLFESTQNAAIINSIIHPFVKENYLEWKKQHFCFEFTAIESAILIESGFEKYVNSIILVSASPEIRLKRVLERDHSTPELIERRIKAQTTDRIKQQYADFIVTNDGESPLIPQILSILSQLRRS